MLAIRCGEEGRHVNRVRAGIGTPTVSGVHWGPQRLPGDKLR